MDSNFKKTIKEVILDEESFVKATFSGFSAQSAYIKVVTRPVLIKNRRHLQLSFFDSKKDITKNFSGRDIETQIDHLLRRFFKNAYLITTDGDIQIQINEKGKAKINYLKGKKELDLSHDKPKKLILSLPEAAEFLKEIGVMTEEGKIRADKQKKFTQINEFLKLINLEKSFERLNIVDLGCGDADLTFAAYYYFNFTLKIPTSITGVDIKKDVLDKHSATVKRLGWESINFVNDKISNFKPEVSPDIVLALHACDTATDEALQKAITWGSKFIFAVPCCHHNLQAQLENNTAPKPFEPMLKSGIIKEKIGDLLTDTFRALILKTQGYKTDIIQFVSEGETPKNLMIRAIKVESSERARFEKEYKDLKAFWKVTPYLEKLLGKSF